MVSTPYRRPDDPIVEGLQRLAADLALPYDQHSPAPGFRLRQRGRVPLDVALQLLPPEVCPRLRQLGPLAAGVLVPEASVDEHGDSARGEHQVGLAGQVAAVEPEAQPPGVQVSADRHFGLGVLATHTRHDAAALISVVEVHRDLGIRRESDLR